MLRLIFHIYCGEKSLDQGDFARARAHFLEILLFIPEYAAG